VLKRRFSVWCPNCKIFKPASIQFCDKCGGALRFPLAIVCLALLSILALIHMFCSGGYQRLVTPAEQSAQDIAH
jgi:hypothetical protein